MGAEQSKHRDRGTAAESAAPKKTDYYDLLGVVHQATDDEIKKAYRKKALELHPDRNYGDAENATQRFAEVQAAYEVLSDAQERAWYDSHRDIILRGGDPDETETAAEYHNVRMTRADELYTLIGRFNSTVPFIDAPNGFFGMLRSTFDSLAQQEVAAWEWDGKDAVHYPPFGSADDGYEDVARPFYSAWSNFATHKSFGWKEKWCLRDAPSRSVRRLMEKENKKLREDGIRDFNDAVRSLVAFVRKRDPRYVPNTQTEAERQKALRDSAAAQAARSRAANQEKLKEFVIPDWALSRDDELPHNDFSESDEESEVEQIECVVCSKIFKSEKQFEAHEKSKKHAKAVQQLRRDMKKEDVGLALDEPSGATTPTAPPIEEDNKNHVLSAEEEPPNDESAPFCPSVEAQQRNIVKHGSPRSAANTGSDSEGEQNGDYVPREVVEERLASAKPPVSRDPLSRKERDEVIDEVTDGISDQVENRLTLDEDVTATKKIGKAKAKREKRTAREAVPAQAGTSQQHTCAVCNAPFESKTKLFTHLKEKDHAVAPTGKAIKVGKKKR